MTQKTNITEQMKTTEPSVEDTVSVSPSANQDTLNAPFSPYSIYCASLPNNAKIYEKQNQVDNGYATFLKVVGNVRFAKKKGFMNAPLISSANSASSAPQLNNYWMLYWTQNQSKNLNSEYERAYEQNDFSGLYNEFKEMKFYKKEIEGKYWA